MSSTNILLRMEKEIIFYIHEEKRYTLFTVTKMKQKMTIYFFSRMRPLLVPAPRAPVASRALLDISVVLVL